jgi:endonuclease/exonuclease/phosphatase family metal-dependent hydrolase
MMKNGNPLKHSPLISHFTFIYHSNYKGLFVMNKENLPEKRSALQALILPSLIMVFGLQALRVFIPGLAWYLRDTVKVGTLNLIPYAFGTFFVGFLAILIGKFFRARLSILISGCGLVLIRMIDHLVRNPSVDLWLGIASVGLFLIFIPIFIGWAGGSDEPYPGRLYKGFLLGFALDSGIRGLFGMRDLSTVEGWIPLALTTLLGLLAIWSLWQETSSKSRQFAEARCKSAALLLFLGPYTLLQLFYLQNNGWLEEVSGLIFPVGFLIISLGSVASICGFDLAYARPRSLHPSLAIGSNLLLIYGVYYANQLQFGAILLILVGQFILGWGFGGIAKANLNARYPSIWRITLSVNGGMVLFLILAFAYYISQDIALPISNASFPALAAGASALFIILASFQIKNEPDTDWNRTGLAAASLFVLIPIIFWFTWGTGPKAEKPPGLPIRVMSYNIHSAFNVAGRQDLEEVATVIEEAEADIIGLQEVSRTRLMDGGPDMPTWLAGRLDMELVFVGTDEPIWGNAILSRYPILDSGYESLPREDSLIGRGFLWVRVDVGEEESLLVVNTHLHHIVEDGYVRLAQIPEILDFLENEDRFILMGDLNADPGSPEIGLIYERGLVDTWLEMGEGQGYTVDSNDPYNRIDYLFLSPDLVTLEIEVIQITASDHMPVIGRIDTR